MDGNKPIASLNSGLLARKGFARPAMRSPLHQYPLDSDLDSGAHPGADLGALHDDLGWNDMGESPSVPPQAEVVAISEAAESALADADRGASEFAKPEVVRQQEAMARLIRIPSCDRRPRGTALSEGRRAAFTLRVDAERHLALRVACELSRCSAQVLLLEALDRMLADMPDIAANLDSLKPQS